MAGYNLAFAAMTIAAFGAALLGFLGGRLGDTGRAAAVSAGQLDTAQRESEVAALTWSWRTTQLGIGLLCLALSTVVVLLIRTHHTRRRTA
ncbi:hypothetical protein [Streptomyces sp. NPDC021020]|uniref:hypothetical protein n=1 Tax=Streptomyces sp. NPDC021020 TaxID=3365109 RepID=UPI0037985C9C